MSFGRDVLAPWDGHVPLQEHRESWHEIARHLSGYRSFWDQTRGVSGR